jgi:hypothetical protein
LGGTVEVVEVVEVVDGDRPGASTITVRIPCE